MNIGGRKLTQIMRAVVRREHYIALGNMIRFYPDFLANLSRYLLGTGAYPYDIRIRTPIGLVKPRLYSHHDLLTVNEVFCRRDYYASKDVESVLDLGSNIGISALYFLTRNRHSHCFLFEPDPRNVVKLKRNLAGFEDRYNLNETAVGDCAGEMEFGIEGTGRYGGLGLKHGQSIKVTCVHINDAVSLALKTVPYIDILKIDTEGMEIRSVQAILPSLLKKIKVIYLEAKPDRVLHPDLFEYTQYGSVCWLVRRAGNNDVS